MAAAAWPVGDEARETASSDLGFRFVESAHRFVGEAFGVDFLWFFFGPDRPAGVDFSAVKQQAFCGIVELGKARIVGQRAPSQDDFRFALELAFAG